MSTRKRRAFREAAVRGNGILAGLLVTAVGLGPAVAQEEGAPNTAPYSVLDRIEGTWVDLNVFPVRPMVVVPGVPGFYAVNPHASTVEYFDGSTASPQAVYDVPWGPVSIGAWTHPDTTQEQLLVASRGNHVLTRMVRATGEVLEVLKLPHEPADLLVDPARDEAWVSCTGADTVVQIDLVTGATTEYTPWTHPGFRVKNPQFLTLSGSGRLMVAPATTGNNSTPEQILLRRASTVLDLDDPNVAVQGLPDEDLFRIDQGTQTTTPIGKAVGTNLFAIRVNPVSGKTWVLNTEANNKGPDRQTEAGVRGDVVRNRLTIIRPNITVPPPVPDAIVDLDDSDPVTPGVQFDPAYSLGQPYALDFKSDGHGFVTGLLTDRFVELDVDGARVGAWDLPEGSIPRGVQVDEGAGVVRVYCWGTSEVREYALAGMQLAQTYQLHRDPTPAKIARGRELFYDASHSLHNNASCNSCHLEMKTDHLVWNLSDPPRDSKGPLLTQTMSGLAPLAPLHWRGERAGLADFNAAFFGLMGGDPLGVGEGSDFEAFEAFVLAVAVPANPHQNRERVVDGTLVPPGVGLPANSDAVNGQNVFLNHLIAGDRTCNTCHTMPLGTNHDLFGGEPSEVHPKRVFFKTVPFHENYRKVTEKVAIETYVDPQDPGQGTTIRNIGYLGSSVTHSGLIEDFLVRISDFGLGPQNTPDTTSFVLQSDQGLAPVVHWAFHLSSATLAATQPELETYLMPQAAARHCDVVVVGTVLDGIQPVRTRWAWDRVANHFVPDHATLTPRSLADFIANVAGESNTFYAMPVGMAMKYAVDHDLDGLVNAVDPAPLDPLVDPQDSSGPSFTEAPEVVWNTLKTARVAFATDEPAVYRVEYSNGVTPPLCTPRSGGCTEFSEEFSRAHAVLLTDLVPSTNTTNGVFAPVTFTYNVTVEVRDRAGNSTTFQVPQPFSTAPIGPGDLEEVVVGDLSWRYFHDTQDPSSLFAAVDARVDYKRGGPPAVPTPGRLLIGRLLVDGEVHDNWEPVGDRTFRADRVRTTDAGAGTKDMDLDGPFIVGLETNAFGLTQLAFRVDGLSEGQLVTFNVEAVLAPEPSQIPFLRANLAAAQACSSGGSPTADCDGDGTDECCLLVPVVFAGRSMTNWSLPDTPAENRALDEVFDPTRATRSPTPNPK